MLENYSMEDDPLEAFKRRQSQLEQVRVLVSRLLPPRLRLQHQKAGGSVESVLRALEGGMLFVLQQCLPVTRSGPLCADAAQIEEPRPHRA